MILDKPFVSKDNVNKEEMKALYELCSNEGLTIRKTDKGGAVVIMDTNEYIMDILSSDE